MDASPAMGNMLTEMQGCLKQLCGSSVLGDPEAVAQLMAEKVAAMNISPGPNSGQDSDGDVLALPAPAQAPAPVVHVAPSAEAQACTTAMIQAPPLYNTSGKISSVQLAWSEWSFGSTTIAERVKKIKSDVYSQLLCTVSAPSGVCQLLCTLSAQLHSVSSAHCQVFNSSVS